MTVTSDVRATPLRALESLEPLRGKLKRLLRERSPGTRRTRGETPADNEERIFRHDRVEFEIARSTGEHRAPRVMKVFVIVSTVCVLHSVVLTFADRDGVVDVGANRSSDVAVGDGDGAETAVIEDPVASQWKTIETEAKALVQKFVGMSYRDALRLVYEAELSADCIVGLTTTLKGLQELDAEVVRMMDASGKIPSGFSDGSLAELGDFDMCLRINVRNQQGETQYRGQYCSLTLDPPLPPKPPIIRNNVPVISTEGFANNSAVKELLTMAWGLYTTRLRMGFCVPDVCSPPEIARLFQIVAAKAYLNTTLLGCEREEGLTLSTSQIVAM